MISEHDLEEYKSLVDRCKRLLGGERALSRVLGMINEGGGAVSYRISHPRSLKKENLYALRYILLHVIKITPIDFYAECPICENSSNLKVTPNSLSSTLFLWCENCERSFRSKLGYAYND